MHGEKIEKILRMDLRKNLIQTIHIICFWTFFHRNIKSIEIRKKSH